MIAIITMAAFTALLNFQTPSAALPQFGDFPANEKFTGKPAPPVLATRGQRLFRTRIREASAAGPNFAGRYTVAVWGCGTACISFAVIDEKTGTVYDPPFPSVTSYLPPEDGGPIVEPLAYRVASRLLVVRGCPNEENCASYYYEWTGAALKLVRKARLGNSAR